MGQGDNIPGNIQTTQEYVLATNYNIVMIFMCLFILITVILLSIVIVNKKTIKQLKQSTQTNTEEEQELIYKFRKLSNKNKNIIYETITAITENENDGI